MLGLRRNNRDCLDRRRARADDTDPQPAGIDALVRPRAGVISRALELIEAREVGYARCREAARGHDAEARPDVVALISEYGPTLGLFVVGRRDDRGLEVDAALEIEPFGDMVGIFEDLRLSGELFAPPPVLLQFLRKGIGILHALDVASGTRIAVPVPGAPDTGRGIEDANLQAEFTQLMEHVEPAEASTDDNGVRIVLTLLARLSGTVCRFGPIGVRCFVHPSSRSMFAGRAACDPLGLA